ncbi:MAG: DUF1194 domain-containing protein [Parcubacteria group bacterium]|nr:DUF1194 domain-containing protein [Parcubacteria group bacterium]
MATFMRTVIVACLCFMWAVPTHAQESPRPFVSVALVLAVDVSVSIDTSEFVVQRSGYADAFRSEAVLAAIQASGGPVAVTLVQWSSKGEYKQTIGWHVIDSPASAEEFAMRIESMPRDFDGNTCIADAIAFSTQLALSAPFKALRKVIDISGDGRSDCDEGNALNKARHAATSKGITINGLAIQDPYSHYNLLEYYRESVIAGDRSFVLGADRKNTFSDALRQKLEMELVAQL